MSAHNPIALLALCLSAALAVGGERPPDIAEELRRARQSWQKGDALEVQIRAALNSGNEQYLKLIEQQESAYDQAKTAFIQALSKAPRDPLALSEFGRFWLTRRELGQARRFLEAALQNKSGGTLTKPEEADLHRIAGALAERAGESPWALLHYRAALEADPGNPRNRLSLAIGLCAGGQPHDAAALLRPLLEKKDDAPGEKVSESGAAIRALEFYTLAVALEETGFIEDSLSSYRKALQISEKTGGDALGIAERAGMSVARLEDLFDAIAENTAARARENAQRKARNLEPLPDDRENLAIASRLCDQAIKFKEQALDDPELVKALARVRGITPAAPVSKDGAEARPVEPAGDVSTKVMSLRAFKDSFLPAMQMLQEAVTRYPKLARAYYELAMCNVMLGKFGAARKLLDEAAAHSPNNLAIQNLHGEVLLQLGQWEGAIDAFKRLLSLEPDSGRANLGLAWASLGMQLDLRQCQSGLDALDRAEQLGVRANPDLRKQLVALVERFEKGEAATPVPKIRGSRSQQAPGRAPGVLEPWGLGR